jgi:hypothetical protein
MFFDGRTVCRQGSVACVRPAGGVGLVARKRAPTPSGWLVEVRLRGRSLAPLRTLLRRGESLCCLMAVQSVGKALWLACDLLAALAWSPASGLLRRPAPRAGQGPLAGEMAWPFCALCVAAVNPCMLRRQHPAGLAGEPAGPRSVRSTLQTVIGAKPA